MGSTSAGNPASPARRQRRSRQVQQAGRLQHGTAVSSATSDGSTFESGADAVPAPATNSSKIGTF